MYLLFNKKMFLSRTKIGFEKNFKKGSFYSDKVIISNHKIKICQVPIYSSAKYIDSDATHIYLINNTVYTQNHSLKPTIENCQSLSNLNTITTIDKYLPFCGTENDVEDVCHLIKLFYFNRSAQGLIWTLTSAKKQDSNNMANPYYIHIFEPAYNYMLKLYIDNDCKETMLVSHVFLKYPIQNVNKLFCDLTSDKTTDRFKKMDYFVEFCDKYGINIDINEQSQKYNFIRLCKDSDQKMLEYVVKYFENKSKYFDIHFDNDDALCMTLLNNNYMLMYWLIKLSKTHHYEKYNADNLRHNEKIWKHPIYLTQISEMFSLL